MCVYKDHQEVVVFVISISKTSFSNYFVTFKVSLSNCDCRFQNDGMPKTANNGIQVGQTLWHWLFVQKVNYWDVQLLYTCVHVIIARQAKVRHLFMLGHCVSALPCLYPFLLLSKHDFYIDTLTVC